MKHLYHFALCAVAMALSSCAGGTIAKFDPATGNPTLLAALDGFGHKADATAREQIVENPHTGFRYEARSVQQKPDGTEIATTYTRSLFSFKMLKEWLIGDRIVKQGEADATLKGTNDPEHIPVDPHQPVTPGNPNYVAPPEVAVDPGAG